MIRFAFKDLELRLALLVGNDTAVLVGLATNDELVHLHPVLDDAVEDRHVLVVELVDVNVLEVGNLKKVIPRIVVDEAGDRQPMILLPLGELFPVFSVPLEEDDGLGVARNEDLVFEELHESDVAGEPDLQAVRRQVLAVACHDLALAVECVDFARFRIIERLLRKVSQRVKAAFIAAKRDMLSYLFSLQVKETMMVR